MNEGPRPAGASAELAPTARRILAAAQDILAERGYAELTMTAISQVSGVNRALVSY
ncbi:MAG: TetR family transcriptional regulator, partial [Thermoleophilia bacterium]|nr:TetR family transcriptional regulator [Thermoleophilia bacterium]